MDKVILESLPQDTVSMMNAVNRYEMILEHLDIEDNPHKAALILDRSRQPTLSELEGDFQ